MENLVKKVVDTAGIHLQLKGKHKNYLLPYLPTALGIGYFETDKSGSFCTNWGTYPVS